MEEEKEKTNEIDLMELLLKLWNKKRLLLYWTIAGAVCGLIIAFSIPKEYTTHVKLAPETATSGRSAMGGLGALASMAGFSSGANSSADAVYPQLYPDVVSSVPFSTGLFDVKIKTSNDTTITVKEYIEHDIREPWWKVIMSLPGKILSGKKEVVKIHEVDNFNLTPEEAGLVAAIAGRIHADVDQKTNIITIQVMMQDPVASAVLADTVVSRLQEYVTDYRTNKARKDLAYAEKLNEEARQQYYAAQQQLADYTDRNQNLATRSAQITKDRLDNETSLAFDLYNQTSQQVQAAKAKVQENTPVFTVITPASVPMRPTSPKKGLIIGGFAFLAFVCCAAWILFGKPLKDQYKQRLGEAGNSDTSPKN